MKYLWYSSLLLTLSLVFFASDFKVLKAQVSAITGADVNVEMTPENPRPNQIVYVTLTSYTTDINSATVAWKINGKTISKGVGQKTFQFVTGDAGSTTTLEIVVTTLDGRTVTNTFKIKPSSVDLIWQSGGYVPPFYKGKALFAHQDDLTVVAMPHLTSSGGSEISPNNLIYEWKVNGSVKENASGYGKNRLDLVGSLISRQLKVEVTVSSPTNSATGYAQTLVNPVDPFVVFYKKDPIYGIEFQNTLSNTEFLESPEITVVAEPFFFGTDNPHNNLSYKWFINGVSIDSDTSQTTRVFRQTEGVSGTSNIGLTVEHLDKILQLASTNFNLMFGKTTATN